MIWLVILVASVSTVATTTPSRASQCAAPNEIATALPHWAATHKRLPSPMDHDSACRALAAALVESVTARQLATTCAGEAGRRSAVEALDAEINAFNDLLAAECPG